jgi:Flp pilus assembly protein protease CpaA
MPAAAMPRSGIELMFLVTFTVLMTVAAGTDIGYRRIPNSLVLAILVTGGVFEVISVGPLAALIRISEGAGAGLLMWFPFWSLGMLGAGDVKFFAAASAWLGPRLALEAALSSAVLGGVIALVWLLSREWPSNAKAQALSLAANPELDDCEKVGDGRDAGQRSTSLPYGVAMAAGLAVTAWFPHLFH